MIQNTFQIFKGIGSLTEKRLWESGIKDWDAFLRRDSINGISSNKKAYMDYKIRLYKSKIEEEDYEFFTRIMPSRLHYRCYHMIKEDLLYIDLESYGHKTNRITIIGLSDGENTRIIRGDNTDSSIILGLIVKAKGIITYNGKSYDLPLLIKQYNISIVGKIVIDLKHLLRTIGYSGGLKKIEKDMGIIRSMSYDVSSGDPIRLWRAYKATGDEHYLGILSEYVEYDVTSLPILMEKAYYQYKSMNGL
ncbi:MAG: ribonuclease H-like domain-containing protein [Candidatus Woesearchaeota archaeon]